jgi:hypothetical protein
MRGCKHSSSYWFWFLARLRHIYSHPGKSQKNRQQRNGDNSSGFSIPNLRSFGEGGSVLSAFQHFAFDAGRWTFDVRILPSPVPLSVFQHVSISTFSPSSFIASEAPELRRLPIGDTADYQSALRGCDFILHPCRSMLEVGRSMFAFSFLRSPLFLLPPFRMRENHASMREFRACSLIFFSNHPQTSQVLHLVSDLLSD